MSLLIRVGIIILYCYVCQNSDDSSFYFDLQDLPNLVAVKDTDFSEVDAVFCCLPHGTTQVVYCYHALHEIICTYFLLLKCITM
jgi:hypothetical protein